MRFRETHSPDRSCAGLWRCYLEPQLVDASSGAQDWMYCEGLVDYDAVRAASVTMYDEAMASVKAEEVTARK